MLASGSRGNSTIVASTRTRILVDAGLSCRELFKRMKAVGEDPASLTAILITHEHQDHVQGVSVTARKLGIPVYFTEPTHRAWMRWMVPQKRMTYADWLAQRKSENEAKEAAQAEEMVPCWSAEPLIPEAESTDSIDLAASSEDCVEEVKDPCSLPGVEYFHAGSCFSIGDIAITPFTIPHDAADPCGFVFTAEGIRLAIATDLGYMPSNVQMHLQRCDVLMLESNHDVEMLRDGPYPWSVKQRVMSRVGHLSNDAASKFLERTYDGHATYVILAHLSESNNLPALARISAERALQNRMSLLGNKLILARQSEPIEAISL